MLHSLCLCVLTTALIGTCGQPTSAADPTPESYLVGGKLADGESGRLSASDWKRIRTTTRCGFALGGGDVQVASNGSARSSTSTGCAIRTSSA